MRCTVGKDVGIAACRGPVQISRVAEQVGRSPEQFDTAAVLFFFQDFGNRIEIAMRFGQVATFGSDVTVVECVVGGLQFFE